MKNLIITFLFFTISSQSISIIVDISQRMHRLEQNKGTIKEALFLYYPFWSIWLANTFSPISVFLSVIFFTSKLTKNLEIDAIMTSGISFKRFTYPYIISSMIIGTMTLLINYYLLPIANKKKNEFHYQYLLSSRYKNKYENNQYIIDQISKNEYIFLQKFFKKKNIGIEYIYEKFLKKKLTYIIKSKYIFWNHKSKTYTLYDYYETRIQKKRDVLTHGKYKIVKIPLSPNELLPEEYIAETMNIHDLKNFIDRKTNDKNINIYLNEFYQRTSLPFSTFIFTILGLSISSIKKLNIHYPIIIGIIFSFVYIFLSEVSKILSTKYGLSSLISIWLPNIFFGFIAMLFFCYRNFIKD